MTSRAEIALLGRVDNTAGTYLWCKNCGREWEPRRGRQVGFLVASVRKHINACYADYPDGMTGIPKKD